MQFYHQILLMLEWLKVAKGKIFCYQTINLLKKEEIKIDLKLNL